MTYSEHHSIWVWPLTKKLIKFVVFMEEYLNWSKEIQAVGKVWINEKLEFFKLESFHLRWKVPIEAGKFSMQYSRNNQKISNFDTNFPTSFFPISIRIFPLLVFPTFLSNYMRPGQSHSILSKVATRWRYFTYNLDFLRSHFLPIMFSLSKKSCFWKKLYLCRKYKNEPLDVDPYWWKGICDFLWWPSVWLKLNPDHP